MFILQALRSRKGLGPPKSPVVVEDEPASPTPRAEPAFDAEAFFEEERKRHRPGGDQRPSTCNFFVCRVERAWA